MVNFDIDNSFKKKENNKLKASFDGRNILVVDDSDINAEVICGLLQQRGAYTTMALNGRSAIEIFMNSEMDFYDAVLMLPEGLFLKRRREPRNGSVFRTDAGSPEG